jgi:F-type H+-transporting ATPase subunit epsilon
MRRELRVARRELLHPIEMRNPMTSTSALRCVVVTPEETVLDTEATFVALPLFDGEIGIAIHHSPMIGRMGYGELRIRAGSETSRYYVDGGFVQIADNLVSVLTNRAIAVDAIDAEVASEQLNSTLNRKATGDEEIAIRDRTLLQARAQLRMARRPK